MEEVAQGRVWTGKDAASHGLIDAIGGLSRAVAIAKLKAGIPQDRQVGFDNVFVFRWGMLYTSFQDNFIFMLDLC